MNSYINLKTKLIPALLTCAILATTAASAQHVPRAERDRISRGGGNVPPAGYPTAPRNDWYSAVVTHPAATDFWASAAFNQQYLAVDQAMGACKRVMGDGCKVMLTQTNGVIAVARDQYGSLQSYRHNTKRQAARALKNWCKEENFRCTELMIVRAQHVFDTYDERTMTNVRIPPDLANIRRKYAAAAIDHGQTGADGFLASGYNSLEEAKAAALKACQNGTPGPDQCKHFTATGNRYFANVFESSGTNGYLETGYSEAEIKPAIKDFCKKQKWKDCRVEEVFDLRRSGIFRYKTSISR